MIEGGGGGRGNNTAAAAAAAVILIVEHQRLVYNETSSCNVPSDSDYHIAIYIAQDQFLNVFKRLHQDGLTWVSPKFGGATTVEGCIKDKQFRTFHIQSLTSQQPAYCLEHEVRCETNPYCPIPALL